MAVQAYHSNPQKQLTNAEIERGHRIFLRDAMRASLLTTLVLPWRDMAPSMYKFILSSVDIGNLQVVKFGPPLSGQDLMMVCGPLGWADLHLKHIALYGAGERDVVAPALQKLLNALNGETLEHLCFSVIVTAGATLPLELEFKSPFLRLRSVDMTRYFVLVNLAAAAPHMEKICLRDNRNFRTPAARVYNLASSTQPSLRHIHWSGDYWVPSLATLSPFTLINITDLQILFIRRSFFSVGEIFAFTDILKNMPNLVKLAFGYTETPPPDPGVLSLALLDQMFTEIPARLELFSVAVADWNVDEVVGAVQKMPSLKEMYLVTDGHVRAGDVLKINRETGIEWFAVQYTGNMGVFMDEDWETVHAGHVDK